MKYFLAIFLCFPLLSWADADADFLAIRDAFRKGDAATIEKNLLNLSIAHLHRTLLIIACG